MFAGQPLDGLRVQASWGQGGDKESGRGGRGKAGTSHALAEPGEEGKSGWNETHGG